MRFTNSSFMTSVPGQLGNSGETLHLSLTSDVLHPEKRLECAHIVGFSSELDLALSSAIPWA